MERVDRFSDVLAGNFLLQLNFSADGKNLY